MKRLIFILILLFSFSAYAEKNRTVIIISIDALHPDAVNLVKPKTIGMIMKKGFYTLKGKSVHPPKTLVNHTAMTIGKTPKESGYVSNIWKKGDNRVKGETIFHDAKKAGLKTYWVYSKSKLGFLNNKAVDKSIFAGDDAVYKADKIVKENKSLFMFLHISGLDFVGPEHGWLSKEYLEEFSLIDEDIANIVKTALSRKNVTLIITSDHSGHAKIHGSSHPEDYKMPFFVYSDMADFSDIQNKPYRTNELRKLIQRIYK